jgi:hypothetical protein
VEIRVNKRVKILFGTVLGMAQEDDQLKVHSQVSVQYFLLRAHAKSYTSLHILFAYKK